jgi:peptide/nickel transport system substrate-binding protein
MRIGSITRASAIAGVLALALTACSSGSQQSASTSSSAKSTSNTGAKVTLTIGGEPTTLDPQARDDGNLRAVVFNVYERLMDRTPAAELIPELAASAPTSINPTTWQVKLRTGIKFTDGTAFNADAAVFSIKRILSATLKSELASSLSTITDATKVDDTTINIVTKAPDPILPSRLVFIAMMSPQSAATAATTPVGTGPYKFAEWAHGDHITLKINDAFSGTKPSIGQVTYIFPEQSGTRLAGLLSGQSDLVTNLLPDETSQAPKLVTSPGSQHALIILDAISGVTADVRVRQALNYAVDTKALASKLFGGYATPDKCQIVGTSWTGYNPALQPYTYDVARAKALLKQAGAVGATITLVGESGRWLKDADFTQAVGQYWRDAGLNVKTEVLQFDQYLNVLFDGKKRPPAIILYHDNSLFDADRSVSTYYAKGGGGASNNDPKILALANTARSELDSAKRLNDYAQILKSGCDQGLFYFGLQVQDIYGVSKRLAFVPRQDGELHVQDMSVN